DGGCLYPGQERSCPGRRALRVLPGPAAGEPGPRPVLHLLLPGRDRHVLGRLLLRRRIVGDQRTLEHHRGRSADLSLQGHHPDRRLLPASAGLRRGRALRAVPQAGLLAVTRGGRRGGRRRQADGAGAGQGRRHRRARRLRHRPARERAESMRKEIWFGLSILAAVVIALIVLMPAPADMTNGHLGLLMLALIVVTIMLGFPTAFTLMGMGVMFTLFAYRGMGMELAIQQTLDLMVLRTYAVMTNDVLIAVPLFIFMGYLVERANLIQSLFQSMHLALARIPGSLAVATVATCALFATATGIVGAVVTLMGLLALPAMLRAGYGVQLSAGAITAGGCLGIMLPPSVLLILYGA